MTKPSCMSKNGFAVVAGCYAVDQKCLLLASHSFFAQTIFLQTANKTARIFKHDTENIQHLPKNNPKTLKNQTNKNTKHQQLLHLTSKRLPKTFPDHTESSLSSHHSAQLTASRWYLCSELADEGSRSGSPRRR